MGKKRKKEIVIFLVSLIVGFILVYGVLNVYDLITENSLYEMSASNMEHKLNFDSWFKSQSEEYFRYGITKNEFLNFPIHGGIKKGETLFVRDIDPSDIKVGD